MSGDEAELVRKRLLARKRQLEQEVGPLVRKIDELDRALFEETRGAPHPMREQLDAMRLEVDRKFQEIKWIDQELYRLRFD